MTKSFVVSICFIIIKKRHRLKVTLVYMYVSPSYTCMCHPRIHVCVTLVYMYVSPTYTCMCHPRIHVCVTLVYMYVSPSYTCLCHPRIHVCVTLVYMYVSPSYTCMCHPRIHVCVTLVYMYVYNAGKSIVAHYSIIYNCCLFLEVNIQGLFFLRGVVFPTSKPEGKQSLSGRQFWMFTD